MIIKNFIYALAVIAALLVSVLTIKTYAQQTPITEIGVGNYSCTITSNCGNQGSVSCTGQSCSRGWMWVECDGKRTDC